MSHRDPASGRVLAPRHLAYIALSLLPLSFWSCDLLDATNLDINGVGGSSGSAGSAAGSGGSTGGTMSGSGGSGGSTAGSSGSSGSAGTGGSSGSSGSAGTGGSSGASGSAGTGGTGGTTEDPDGGTDAAVPDSGGGNTSTFNCTNGDSACALCEVWTQLVDCQPAETCPDTQRTALSGLGCDAQYTAYLDCYAAEPLTSSTCVEANPSTRLADTRLGGTGTENNCQAQECALYDCLGALDPPGCP